MHNYGEKFLFLNVNKTTRCLQKNSVHLFQFQKAQISLSAKSLCKYSAQTLAHSQFMLIARTLTQQNLSTSSYFVSPAAETVILRSTAQNMS